MILKYPTIWYEIRENENESLCNLVEIMGIFIFIACTFLFIGINNQNK